VPTALLVGSGGYKGPPVRREVEIGYEIAPAYRRRGYATAATLAMTRHAFETGLVDTVVAQTVAEENASTKVLRSSGYEFVGEFEDPDDGLVWRWVHRMRA
jgi:RimJ/RimL family protein N-acetyltransferase